MELAEGIIMRESLLWSQA